MDRPFSGLDGKCPFCGGTLSAPEYFKACKDRELVLPLRPLSGVGWHCHASNPHLHRFCMTCCALINEHPKNWIPSTEREMLLATVRRALESAFPETAEGLLVQLEKQLIPPSAPPPNGTSAPPPKQNGIWRRVRRGLGIDIPPWE